MFLALLGTFRNAFADSNNSHDVLLFGGTKLSGVARMGIWSMLQEMTETRVVWLNL